MLSRQTTALYKTVNDIAKSNLGTGRVTTIGGRSTHTCREPSFNRTYQEASVYRPIQTKIAWA